MPYSLSAVRAGLAEDLDCEACVAATEVAFSYAGSASAGGPAQALECSVACVQANELDNAAVTNPKIAPNAVNSSQIIDETIATDDLADAAVTTAKIADGACLAELLDDDGADSGLDADLLDGQQGAYYQNASNLNAGSVADARLSANVVLLNNAQTISGAKTFSAVIASTVAAGTAPFTVASTTAVTNLNADLLDDQHGSYYRNASNINAGTLGDARLSTNVMLLNNNQTVTGVKTFGTATITGNLVLGALTLSGVSGTNPACSASYLSRYWSARTCTAGCAGSCTTTVGWYDAPPVCTIATDPVTVCTADTWTRAFCISN